MTFACPVDKTPLGETLECSLCGRTYEYYDDIPILTPPQLRENIEFDDYKYLDDPINPAWNAGLVTTWDFVKNQLLYEIHHPYTFSGNRYRWFRDKVVGDVVIDIGCNGGGVTNLLAPAGRKECYGLDFLLRHLLYAKKTTSETIIYVNGAAEYLPFVNEYFDTTCLGEMMEHVPNPKLAVIEAIRVLKPGGKILIVNQDKPIEFRPGAVRHTINPCNFDQLTEFLDTMPLDYTAEKIDGSGGMDPNGIFVEGYKE
jgi:SAM-dependent methyltransferase